LQSEAPFGLALTIDLYVNYPAGLGGVNDTNADIVERDVYAMSHSIETSFLKAMDHRFGVDAGQFVLQLQTAQDMKKKYDVILKVENSKHFAQHARECLCGTPSHVIAILSAFAADKDLQLVVPRGMIFSANTDKATLHPMLMKTVFHTGTYNP
jgi:hypothetical protein